MTSQQEPTGAVRCRPVCATGDDTRRPIILKYDVKSLSEKVIKAVSVTCPGKFRKTSFATVIRGAFLRTLNV